MLDDVANEVRVAVMKPRQQVGHEISTALDGRFNMFAFELRLVTIHVKQKITSLINNDQLKIAYKGC